MGTKAFSDEEIMILARASVELELEKKKLRKEPIAVYDRELQAAVILSDNDEKETLKRLREGRYSERIAKKA